jgi:hypothetical protein
VIKFPWFSFVELILSMTAIVFWGHVIPSPLLISPSFSPAWRSLSRPGCVQSPANIPNKHIYINAIKEKV